MRFALVSDIHANRQAWTAVLRDIRRIGVDGIFCLGDVVGYGPMPEVVLEGVCEAVNELVLGNHDAVIGGRLEENIFSEEAQQVIRWTRARLDPSAHDFLASLPAVVEGDHFLIAHGEVFDPERFGYIETETDAEENFNADPAPLIFVGNTHYPGIFVQDLRTRSIRSITAADFAAQPGMRYIVNVGSVGDPRDGTMEACYCLYDDTVHRVCFRRVPFDVDGYRNDLLDRGLGIVPSFLALRPSAASRPVAERDFSFMRTWAPPRQRTEPPAKVVRVRRHESGMTAPETAEAEAAHAWRRQLAHALRHERETRERQRQAEIEVARAILKTKQEAAETARRRREAEEQEAAEAARARKMKLAQAMAARMKEHEQMEAEARERVRQVIEAKRAAALRQKAEDSQNTPPSDEKTSGLSPSFPSACSQSSPRADTQPSAVNEKPKVVLEFADKDEPALPVEAAVATSEEHIRQRKRAIIRAAEEKRQRRIQEYRLKTAMVREQIRKKAEALRHTRAAAPTSPETPPPPPPTPTAPE